MQGVRIEQRGGDVLLWIKAVPGASCDEIASVLGDRLKIRVAAAPEAGKANQAICALLARALGRKPRYISIESGTGAAEKTIRIAHAGADAVRAALRK